MEAGLVCFHCLPAIWSPRSLCGSTSAFKSRLLDQLPISTPPSPLHPLRSYGSRRLSSRDPQRRFSTNRETFKKIKKCKSCESKQFELRTKKSWVTGNDLVSNPRKQRFTKPWRCGFQLIFHQPSSDLVARCTTNCCPDSWDIPPHIGA